MPDPCATSLYAAAFATLGPEELPPTVQELALAQCKSAAREAADKKCPKQASPVILQRDDRPVATPTQSARHGKCFRDAASDEVAGSAASIAYSAFQEFPSPIKGECGESYKSDERSVGLAGTDDHLADAEELSSIPKRTVRPMATQQCHVAEKWLRFSRIALLELGKLPPPHRRLHFREHVQQAHCEINNHAPTDLDANKWMDMAFPQQEDHAVRGVGISGHEQSGDLTMNKPMHAWAKILTRVLGVTMGQQQSSMPDMDSDDEPTLFETPVRKGHALICLGDIMGESISWLEVDSDEDCHSPTAAAMQQAMQEAMQRQCEEEGEESEPPMPSALKNIHRQQNAPGIVQGMNKCLSF